MHQFSGKPPFGGAKSFCIPFWCISVAGCHKSGLAAHRESDIASKEFFIDFFA